MPCGNCGRWQLECVYPSAIRKCRRPRKDAVEEDAGACVIDAIGATTLTDITLCLERTAKVLGDVIEKCRSPDFPPAQSDELAQQVAEAACSLETAKTGLDKVRELRHGRSIDMGPETVVQNLSPTSTNHVDRRPRATSIATISPRPFPFETFSLDVAAFHPPPKQVRFPWQIFQDNIDPLVKVLHRPSTESILCKAGKAPTSLNYAETAILFTIYFSSLSVMSDADVEACFKVCRSTAMTTYKEAAEQALGRANLMATGDLATLQAFVLFMSLARYTDASRRGWALTGLAEHLRDSPPPMAGGSPFETEIRKRLLWELWYLDHRAAEDCSNPVVPSGIVGVETLLPTNARDIHINPSMECAPRHYNGWSETSFSLIRFEIADVTRKERETLVPLDEEKRLIDDCERRIQHRYLRFCDGSKPIHWLARHVSFVLLMEKRFKLYRKMREQGSAAQEQKQRPEQDALFLAAMHIVDTPTRIGEEPAAKQWSWLLPGYTQFLPLSFLLEKLCVYSECCGLVGRAWDVAEAAFARQMRNDKRSPDNIEVLARLMAEASSVRQAGMMIREPEIAPFSPATCGYAPPYDCLLGPSSTPSLVPNFIQSSERREHPLSHQDDVGNFMVDPSATISWITVEEMPSIVQETSPVEGSSRDTLDQDAFWNMDIWSL